MTPHPTQARARSAWLVLVLTVTSLALLGGFGWFAYARVTADPLAGARDAYARGEYDVARRDARAFLRRHSGNTDALLLIARSTARQGDDASARRFYEALGPDRLDAEDFYLVGSSFQRDGRDELARSAFEAAVLKNQDHVESLAALAALSSKYKMHEMAESFAGRMMKAPGGVAAGSALLGRARLDLGDATAAAERLETALRLDPSVARSGLGPDEARGLLALALLALGRGDEASAALSEIAPAYPDLEWLKSRAALQRGDLDAATAALAGARSAGSPRAEDPMTFEPAPFVGSAGCVECHAAIFRDQQAARHARTFARAPRLHEIPLSSAPIPDPHDPSIKHVIKKEKEDLVVESTIDGEVQRAVIRFMMGSGDKGVTPLGVDESGDLLEMRLSHYPGHGWDPTTGHPEVPTERGQFLGLPLQVDAQRRCLGCHTTNAFAAANDVGPAARDRAIGCETCHGPAGNHLLAVRHGFNDLAIARPKLATAQATVELCGRCHKPTNDLGLGGAGDPLSVRFQAATLVRSACYTKSAGTLDCITCHDPHRDAETNPAFYEAICLSCHSSPDATLSPVRTGAQAPVDPASLLDPSRRVPCRVNPSNGCVTCHMPVSDSAMAHSTFADHHIRIHGEEAPSAED